LDSGITVAALIAVNSLGSVINTETGALWEAGLEMENEFGSLGKRKVRVPSDGEAVPVGNTTIGVVATDAILGKAQAQKVAQMAQDGVARCVRPSHTMFDGDAIFCVATGRKKLVEMQGFFASSEAQAINEIGQTAADCVSRAIIRGVFHAETLHPFKAFRDLETF
jgi:L-aminopeptidase/D-esterase-like protein